tara:strand:- start:768 stop:1079 length:312 start_codon:yes stop_codon:yes gene_type:complete
MTLSIKTLSIFIQDVAIELSDNRTLLLDLNKLRLSCPCAGCSGEKDVLGNFYRGPTKNLKEASFQLFRYELVGLYGVRFFWKDGHHDGIYTFQLLLALSESSV